MFTTKPTLNLLGLTMAFLFVLAGLLMYAGSVANGQYILHGVDVSLPIIIGGILSMVTAILTREEISYTVLVMSVFVAAAFVLSA